MNFILKAGFGIAALAAVAAPFSPAQSADLLPPPPVYPEEVLVSRSWSGCYLGGHFGGGFFDTTYTPSIAPDPKVDGDGYLGGGLAGCNIQVDSLVFGVEGDLSFGELKGKGDVVQAKFDIDYMATIRGRIGWAVDDLLLYATGGIGWLDMKISSASPCLCGSDKETLTGWVVGAGAEWAFWESFSLRGEYLYGHFDEEKFVFPAGATIKAGLDDLHVVRGALVWHMPVFDTW